MATGTAGDTGFRLHIDAVHYLSKTVTYLTLNGAGVATGTTAATVKIGDLPPHAIIIDGIVKVITGFDDTNGDDIDVGVTGDDADLFVSAVDMSSTGRTLFSAEDLASANDYSASAREVTCVLHTAPSGNGTAGEAVISLWYVLPRDQ